MAVPIPVYFRKGDAVLLVRQNNTEHKLEIAHANEKALNLLGYEAQELNGMEFQSLLPERIIETLGDYLDYEQEDFDLSTVLSRVREFGLRHKDGKETTYKLKIMPTTAFDQNPVFQLIIHNEQARQEAYAFRSMLMENFKGHEVLDEETGLPDRSSLQKDLELMHFYASTKGIQACFAVFSIDNYDALLAKYGRACCNTLIRNIATLCRQNLRFGDTIGSLGKNQMGLLLMDVEPDAAKMVLNRLRWLISAHPIAVNSTAEAYVTVSVSYSELNAQTKDAELISRCEESRGKLKGKGSNAIHHVAA
jgi:diguanylate cyclase (GGDEF)-like protein/PAS domain S-box-containing protein